MTDKKQTEKLKPIEELPKLDTVYDVLLYVQTNLHAPKNQYNSFGKYNYRNVEDIQDGLKKILPKGAACYVTDDIVMVGDRIYVKSTATLCYKDKCVSNSAYAREPLSQKGMSDPQVTGSSSSYARKYALGGLFMVDDTKDADSQEPPKNQTKPQEPPKADKPEYVKTAENIALGIQNAVKADALEKMWAMRETDLDEIKKHSEAAYSHLVGKYNAKLKQLDDIPKDFNTPQVDDNGVTHE